MSTPTKRYCKGSVNNYRRQTNDHRRFRKGSCQLEDDLAHLMLKPAFSDFTLIVENKKIPIHKNIVAVRSPVFAAMFRHTQTQEVIQDMTYETACHMVRYMYTGRPPQDLSKVAFGLLIAADKYDLKELFDMCERSLLNTLTFDTVADVFALAHLYNLSNLLKFSVRFMKGHLSAVKKTDGWNRLKNAHPRLIVDHFV